VEGMSDNQFLTLVNMGFAAFIGFPWGWVSFALAMVFFFRVIKERA